VGLACWFIEGIIFPYYLGCLHILGYKLSIHEIMPLEVFLFHLKKRKKKGDKKKRKRKGKKQK